MDRIPVTSSLVLSVGYDSTNQILELEFFHGFVEQYQNVSQQTFNDFLAAPSKSEFCERFIFSKFPSQTIWQSLLQLLTDLNGELGVVVGDQPLSVHMKNKQEQTPLHIAAKWGDVLAVQMLLDAGADIGAVDVDGRDAAAIAQRSGHRNRAAVQNILAASQSR